MKYILLILSLISLLIYSDGIITVDTNNDDITEIKVNSQLSCFGIDKQIILPHTIDTIDYIISDTMYNWYIVGGIITTTDTLKVSQKLEIVPGYEVGYIDSIWIMPNIKTIVPEIEGGIATIWEYENSEYSLPVILKFYLENITDDTATIYINLYLRKANVNYE